MVTLVRSAVGRCGVIGASLIRIILVAAPLAAQEPLIARRAIRVQPAFESWSFGDGVVQPTITGDSIRLEKLTQFSIPIGFSMDLGERWRFGLGGAMARSSISIADGSGSNHSTLTLSGLSDVKLTLTAHIVPDRFLLTFGANVPTGKRELDSEELEELRIVASPALGLQVPALGTGSGGTAGMVVARQAGNWAWALGASYEMRNVYSPYAPADLPAPDFNPSDAIHLSVGTEGIVGENQMTLSLAADVYTEDKVTLAGGEGPFTARPGATWTAEWQYVVAASRLSQLTFYAVDRYRMPATTGDSSITGSAGNYLDLGVRGDVPLGAQNRLGIGLALRQHGGLKVDRSLASAGATLGVLTVKHTLAMGTYSLRSFVRAQGGQLKPASGSVNATGLGAGVTLMRAW